MVSLNVLPVAAQTQNTNVQTKTSRWFHMKRDIALKQANSAEVNKEDKASAHASNANLDYSSDSFIIN